MPVEPFQRNASVVAIIPGPPCQARAEWLVRRLCQRLAGGAELEPWESLTINAVGGAPGSHTRAIGGSYFAEAYVHVTQDSGYVHVRDLYRVTSSSPDAGRAWRHVCDALEDELKRP